MVSQSVVLPHSSDNHSVQYITWYRMIKASQEMSKNNAVLLFKTHDNTLITFVSVVTNTAI